jgi:hypothetical protein
MRAANPVAAWAPQRAFLVVEPDRETLRITPVSVNPVPIAVKRTPASPRRGGQG